MSLATTMLSALGYAATLARPLAREAVDVALDRGLALLTGALPTRTIATCSGDPYLSRSYLAGRLPKGFPADMRTVLGSLDGTAYVHRFHREDLEAEHHSHPWEWAVSIILSGSYVEEVVLADGTIATRERRPGSVGVLTASSFHRVAYLRSLAVRTLFITGPRTPDGAWYFRRLTGEVVLYDEFIREREAERAREARASAPTVVEIGAPALPMLSTVKAARAFDAAIGRGEVGVIVSPAATMHEAIAAMGSLGWTQRWPDELVMRTDLSWCADLAWRTVRLVDAEPRHVRGGTAPMWAHGVDADTLAAVKPLAAAGVPVVVSEATFVFGAPVFAGAVAAERGLEVRADLPPAAVPVETRPWPVPTGEPKVVNVFVDNPVAHAAATEAASKLGVPVAVHWPSLDIEKRITFADGSIAELLASEPPMEDRALIIGRRWRATEGENMASQWARRDIARFEKIARPGAWRSAIGDTSILLESGADDEHRASCVLEWPIDQDHDGRRTFDSPEAARAYAREHGLVGYRVTETRRAQEERDSQDPRRGDLLGAAPPEGYTFEPVDAPSVVIRHHGAYVGSLLTNGRAVSHGREIPPAEVERHADAWAHARAMRGGS